jgi:hypothetical protein
MPHKPFWPGEDHDEMLSAWSKESTNPMTDDPSECLGVVLRDLAFRVLLTEKKAYVSSYRDREEWNT